jgi:hypothetical protein
MWQVGEEQEPGFGRDKTKAHMLEAGAILGFRFLPPNSVQLVARIIAVSPFSTFDSRPSTASGGRRISNPFG